MKTVVWLGVLPGIGQTGVVQAAAPDAAQIPGIWKPEKNNLVANATTLADGTKDDDAESMPRVAEVPPEFAAAPAADTAAFRAGAAPQYGLGMSVAINALRRADGSQAQQLCELLQDSVAGGASVGFLDNLSAAEAAAYWSQVVRDLDAGLCLWVAEEQGRIVGSVQLAPCAKANGRHRAEVQKLLVLRSHRGLGIARRLMAAAEAGARDRGCHLLVLDTLEGSTAASIYPRLGWQRGGAIPQYAALPDGELQATVYFYKLLT